MWFTNINEWSNKKLKITYVFWTILYLGATLFAPLCIIAVKYNIFASSTYSLTGIALIFLIIFAILGLKNLKKLIDKAPETTYKQQKFKYGIGLLYALITPCIIILCLYLIYDNYILALSCLKWCIIFYVIGICIDYLAIHFLDKERSLRDLAQQKAEIDKRVKFTS